MNERISRLKDAFRSGDDDLILKLGFDLEIDALEYNQSDYDAIVDCLENMALDEGAYRCSGFGTLMITICALLRCASPETRQRCARRLFSVFGVLEEHESQIVVAECAAEFLPPREVADLYRVALRNGSQSHKLALIEGITRAIFFERSDPRDQILLLKPVLSEMLLHNEDEVKGRASDVLLRIDARK